MIIGMTAMINPRAPRMTPRRRYLNIRVIEGLLSGWDKVRVSCSMRDAAKVSIRVTEKGCGYSLCSYKFPKNLKP